MLHILQQQQQQQQKKYNTNNHNIKYFLSFKPI